MNNTTAATVVRNHPTAQFSNELTIDGHRFRRHQNGGGLVEDTAFVDPNVHVGRRAMVKDHAIVRGAVRLFGEAIACDRAIITGSCTLRDHAVVAGNAVARDSVQVSGNARADGTAILGGGVKLTYYAHVSAGYLTGAVTLT